MSRFENGEEIPYGSKRRSRLCFERDPALGLDQVCDGPQVEPQVLFETDLRAEANVGVSPSTSRRS